MLTKEAIDEIINNSEFSDSIKDAAPYRVKIIKDISPKMKEHQKDFVEQMVKANFDNIADINNKLKLDKKDAEANAAYKSWNKKVMNIFRAILKSIHPNENQTPSVGMIYVAGKYLNYIGRDDIVQGVMEDKNISISFKKLEDTNKYFDNDDVRAVLKDIFLQADETQGDMCQNADMIKSMFDLVPVELRYDSKTNKQGLKLNNFCTLVRHKAMAIIKDADKYTKYINSQIENSDNNIIREQIIREKTKNL